MQATKENLEITLYYKSSDTGALIPKKLTISPEKIVLKEEVDQKLLDRLNEKRTVFLEKAGYKEIKSSRTGAGSTYKYVGNQTDAGKPRKVLETIDITKIEQISVRSKVLQVLELELENPFPQYGEFREKFKEAVAQVKASQQECPPCIENSIRVTLTQAMLHKMLEDGFITLSSS